MPKFTVRNLNMFLLYKIPSAYIAGVRVKSFSETEAVATVKKRWINQNPFKSLYWAVQGMASELATGILVMYQIKKSKQNISMLVTKQSGIFTKKAKGKIHFTCNDGSRIANAIKKTISTGEGVTVLLTSTGMDENGETVSTFEYEWGLKIRQKK
ncbi:MAG: thioesterase [Flavobacteriales bacterium]|nr:MAG: thioesterase [Flavobacteriales bacterium]